MTKRIACVCLQYLFYPEEKVVWIGHALGILGMWQIMTSGCCVKYGSWNVKLGVGWLGCTFSGNNCRGIQTFSDSGKSKWNEPHEIIICKQQLRCSAFVFYIVVGKFGGILKTYN